MVVHGVAVVVGTLLSLLALGLATGFSPTLIALQVAVLGRAGGPSPAPAGGRASLGALVATGVGTGAFALTVLLQLVNPTTWDTLLDGRVRALVVQRWFDVVAGALMVLSGWWMLRHRRPEPGESRRAARTVERFLDRPGGLFAFAAVNTVLSVSGAAAAYLVLRIGRDASSSWLVHLLVAVGFALTAALPYALMMWAGDRVPAVSRRLDAVVAWVRSRSWRTLCGVLLVVAGAVLGVLAVAGMLGG